MFYLNDHCHRIQEQYTYNVQHKFNNKVCQNRIHGNVLERINIIRNGRQRPLQFIQNDILFKILVMIVDFDIKSFVEFGKKYNINIKTSEISQNLMKLLINYSIIYSLGKYLDSNFLNFSYCGCGCGCGQFSQFCLQTKKQFYSHDLNNIRDKYLKQIKQSKCTIKTNQEKLIQLQTKFTQILETQSNKKATSIFAIHTDIQKIQEYMLQNDKTQFFCDIDLNESFSRECKQIDEASNQTDKFVKVTNWLNHDYIKKYTSTI